MSTEPEKLHSSGLPQWLIDSAEADLKVKREAEAKQRLIDQEEYTKKYTTYIQDAHDFNKIPRSFPLLLTLDELSQRILMFLEARSQDRNGDTKISDKKLCDIFKVSRATIQRRLTVLKKANFIATVEKTKRDPKRLQVAGQSMFYSDRAIRCFRVVVQKGFKILKTPKWKTDPRPEWDPKNIVDRLTGYLIPLEQIRKYRGNRPVVQASFNHYQPAEGSEVWALANGIISPQVLEFYHLHEYRRRCGDSESLKYLGYAIDFKEDDYYPIQDYVQLY
jgi:hypothetical protein